MTGPRPIIHSRNSVRPAAMSQASLAPNVPRAASSRVVSLAASHSARFPVAPALPLAPEPVSTRLTGMGPSDSRSEAV